MARPIKHGNKWRIRWNDEHGLRKSAVFSDLKEALFQLKQKELYVEEIKRGLRVSYPTDKSFVNLCNYWLEKRAVYKRSKKSDQSIIYQHLLPFFKEFTLREITAEKIDSYILLEKETNPKTLSNRLILLISMLNLAKDRGWLMSVPKVTKPRLLNSNKFQYLSTKSEIEKFLLFSEEEGQKVYLLYLTALCTGLRQGELAGLTWSDIDFNQRLITVQRSFNGPTKSSQIRFVPITDRLLIPLKEWKLRNTNTLVFPSDVGTMNLPSGRIFKQIFHRVLENAGFPKIFRNGKLRPYLRFHDLRHTFASQWVLNGGDIYKLQRILGHSTIKMTEKYSHLKPDAYKNDYNIFGVPSSPGAALSLFGKSN